MSKGLFNLTFHRAVNTTQPESFVFEPQRYVRHDGMRAVAEAELRWDEDLLVALSRLAESSGDMAARRRVGAKLRSFLTELSWDIPEDGLSRQPAAGEEPPILTISAGAAELFSLPWELTALPSSNRYLADLPSLLVRYEWPGLPLPDLVSRPAPSAAERPPRVVFAWSAAGGAVPAAEHGAAIGKAIKNSRFGGVRLDTVDNVTGSRLEAALTQNRGPTVLHILCHGALVGPEDGPHAALVWNKSPASTEAAHVDADRLCRLLDRQRSDLRLVILCACLGGDNNPAGRYVGSLAQAIHRLGIPAVVASRYPFSTRGSTRLTRVLYDALLVEGMSLEKALLTARTSLQSEIDPGSATDSVDQEGSLSEDAYSLQFYSRSVECVLDSEGRKAHRPLDASFPFGQTRREPAKRDPTLAAGMPAMSHVPRYPNPEVGRLSNKIEAARAVKRKLAETGRPTTSQDEEILEAQRRLREGGVLQAGDSLRDGRYLLLETLSVSGATTVWKAHDRGGDEIVAIRVLHRESARDATALANFRRTVRSLARLDHANIVHVIDEHGEEAGWHYYVMEYLPGGDLYKAVLGKKAMDVTAVVLEVGDAVAMLHRKGIVHKDINPTNILLDEQNVPKLVDFDNVRTVDGGGSAATGATGSSEGRSSQPPNRPPNLDIMGDVAALGKVAVFGFYGQALPGSFADRTEAFIDSLSCGRRIKEVLKGAILFDVRSPRYVDAGAFCEALRTALAQDLRDFLATSDAAENARPSAAAPQSPAMEVQRWSGTPGSMEVQRVSGTPGSMEGQRVSGTPGSMAAAAWVPQPSDMRAPSLPPALEERRATQAPPEAAPRKGKGLIYGGVAIGVLAAAGLATAFVIKGRPGAGPPATSASAAAPPAAAPRCPPGMVEISSTKRFCMSKTEVTVAELKKCVDGGKCTYTKPGNANCNWHDAGKSNHPMECIGRSDAAKYCGTIGGRLPDVSEWEYASRDGESRSFPWGAADPQKDPEDKLLCWSGRTARKGTCAVGSFPAGATKAGLVDMAGNVAEWVTGGDDAGKSKTCGRAFDATDSLKVLDKCNSAYVAEAQVPFIGFRCVVPVR